MLKPHEWEVEANLEEDDFDLEELFSLVSEPTEEAYFAVLELLENNSVDLNQINLAKHDGKSLIATCASKGHIETFKYLIQKGLNLSTEPDEYTLLYWALQNPYFEMHTYLLDPKEDLYKKLADGTTPLHIAALQGDHDAVHSLLASYPEYITMIDKNGLTALYYAAFKGFREIVLTITHHIQFVADENNKSSLLRGKGMFHFSKAADFSEHVNNIAKGLAEYKKALNNFKLIQNKQKNDYYFMLSCATTLAASYCNINMLDASRDYLRVATECYQIFLSLEVDFESTEVDSLSFNLGEIETALNSKNLSHSVALQSSNEALTFYRSQLNAARLKAKHYGYDCRDVPSDGNCFFHAVYDQLRNKSHLFPGLELSAENFRTLVVKHIIDYQQVYVDKFVDEELDDFLIHANESYYWAHEQMICALSRVLKINIVVLATHTEKPCIYKQSDAIETVYVCNIHNIHFQSMHFNPTYVEHSLLNELLAGEAEDDFVAMPETTTVAREITPLNQPSTSLYSFFSCNDGNSSPVANRTATDLNLNSGNSC